MTFSHQKPVHSVAVLGGGSAGFIAALTLKRRFPKLPVQVIRSPDIGVIGVGEGTTRLFPHYFFQNLRLKPAQLYAEAQPTWKLGLRFLWGRRSHFHYTFSTMLDNRWPELPKNHGFYCEQDVSDIDLWSALMGEDKAFPRNTANLPEFFNHDHVGFHIENHKLVAYLEARCRDFDVVIKDAAVAEVILGEGGVAALRLESGEELSADLYLDASGFRSEILGRAMQRPFLDYSDTLFCDRAVIGGWPRTDESIKPYTTCETMEAGWAWQIEHETWINRGYVYSSRFISDEEALRELTGKNPKIANQPRVVRFRTGRYDTMWCGNVVAIGNASGFVEPLEASALQVIIFQSRTLADILTDTDCQPTPSSIAIYNRLILQHWDEIRDFLAVHYKFNTRSESPFWQSVRAEAALQGAAPIVEYYVENGPTALAKSVIFSSSHAYGLEGYLALLVGQGVPHERPYEAPAQERRAFEDRKKEFRIAAKRAFDVQQTLTAIRQPNWKW